MGEATFRPTGSISAMDEYILRSSIPYKQPQTENLLEFMKDSLRRHSDEVLIINSSDGAHWTGKQMELAIGRLAEFFIDICHIRKGDVISVLEKDQDKVAIVLLAIICTGATCKLISYSVKDAACTIQVAHAKVVITSKEYIAPLKKELNDYKERIEFVSFDVPNDDILNISDHLKLDNKEIGLTFEQLIESVSINPESDIAVIQFSSGTTGKPKRIPRTHKNLCHLVASVAHTDLMDLKPGVRISGHLHIAFRTGLWTLLASIHSGATYIIASFSDLDPILEVVDKFKPTIFSLSVIAMTELSSVIEEKCERYDLTSIKEVITAGAKIVNYEVAQRVFEVLKLSSLRQCFGMTESGWVFLIEKSLSKNQYLTTGHVVPSMEAVVIDPETGRRLGPNERGEIALRGPQIFPGYMTDEKGVYKRDEFTPDGWFRIGDQAYYTEDGLFYIVGRYKEWLTFSNMKRFYPDQIEAILLKHSNIDAACVVKVKGLHDDLYDTARAYLTLREGSSITENDIINYLKENAPLVYLDGGVRFLEKFPKLSNGKINKQLLKTMS